MKKFLVFLCVICMVLSQGVVALAFGGDDEPNDNMSQANPVTVGSEQVGIYGIVGANDDEDWFEINSSISGPCYFRLWYDSRYGGNFDADIYLYDEQGKKIAKGVDKFWSGGKKAGSAIVDYYIRSDRTYYLKVEYKSGYLKEPYNLTLEIN